MTRQMRNDGVRARLIRADEELFLWWQRSRLDLGRFIAENRYGIDATNDPALDPTMPTPQPTTQLEC